jgi:hypothetical protein
MNGFDGLHVTTDDDDIGGARAKGAVRRRKPSPKNPGRLQGSMLQNFISAEIFFLINFRNHILD